jgi:hypothetical protein
MLCRMGADMANMQDESLLDALLDSWDRNNTILINLLRALPDGGLDARTMESSPTVAPLFTHIHFVRLVFVGEDAPELGKLLPKGEWTAERDRDLDLPAAGTCFHLIANAKSRLLQFGNAAWKFRDLHHRGPGARLLLLSVRHRPRTRAAGTAQQNLRVTERNVRKRGKLLMFELEPEVCRAPHRSESYVIRRHRR